jgi:hypothetical protein
LSRLEAHVLETVLAGLEGELGPRRGEPVSLDGGITNRNLRVQFGEHDAVVRLPGKETELLGIDREAERVATAAAASVGVGPEVLAFLSRDGCLVTRFIAGRGLEPEDVRAALGEVVAALRAVHGGPALPSTFDAWDVVDTYRATAQARGGRIPEAFAGLRETAERVRAALTGSTPAWATATSTSATSPSTTVSPRTTTRGCSRPTGASRARRGASPPCA